MLILTRRVGESIVIGDDIFLTLVGFKGKQVAIGFDAPDTVVIHRHEIYKKIKEEEQQRLLLTHNNYSPFIKTEWC